MEWLQDQLLRLAARYYCQDVDIDASKLQIEKWDGESCRVRSDGLKTHERAVLAFRRRVHRTDGQKREQAETQGTLLIAAPWKSIGALLVDGWRGPAVSLQAAILELRTGGAKLRDRNASSNDELQRIPPRNWDVAVASFHNDHVGEARGVSATIARATAIGDGAATLLQGN